MLRHALSLAPTTGVVAEFGVYSSATLREITRHYPEVHGFDSFEGLPEDWRDAHRAGPWAAKGVPDVPGAELHIGWFTETVPLFAKGLDEEAAFLHLAAELYSSTNTVLRELEDRIVPGTVLVFDEYFNYPAGRATSTGPSSSWSSAADASSNTSPSTRAASRSLFEWFDWGPSGRSRSLLLGRWGRGPVR